MERVRDPSAALALTVALSIILVWSEGKGAAQYREASQRQEEQADCSCEGGLREA